MFREMSGKMQVVTEKSGNFCCLESVDPDLRCQSSDGGRGLLCCYFACAADM